MRNQLTLKTLLLSYPKPPTKSDKYKLKTKILLHLKNETKYSEFINHVRNPEHKRIATKFRIGNHNLKIETGRFTIPQTPEKILEFEITAV